MSKIKNGGLDQYGAERFEQQQFGTAGVEGVNWKYVVGLCVMYFVTDIDSLSLRAYI